MSDTIKYGMAAGKGLWHTVDKLGWSKCGIRLTQNITTTEPDPGRHCIKCWGVQKKEANVGKQQEAV